MLSHVVQTNALELSIPGVAVGVWADGEESYACHGVTSLDNPLPVDPDTLFELGSATKPFTATALMRLVARGQVELDAPVRRYIPELRLKDERAAAKITVLNLLNHTAGLDWALLADTGDGDDALAAYVARLDELKLIAAPGIRASYSQSGYNLAGRIIEKVTSLTYENAVASLLLLPLGLAHSFFLDSAIMTRRFAVGHNPDANGRLAVARDWKRWRSNNPGGGLVSSASDQLRWARFHLGDGRAESGEQVLPVKMLQQMKEPTVELRGSTLGDAFGICWFLRDIDGVRTVGHGGSAHGQFAELLIVPERNFAVVSLANAGPNGIPFNQAVVRWALQHYLGVVDRDPALVCALIRLLLDRPWEVSRTLTVITIHRMVYGVRFTPYSREENINESNRPGPLRLRGFARAGRGGYPSDQGRRGSGPRPRGVGACRGLDADDRRAQVHAARDRAAKAEEPCSWHGCRRNGRGGRQGRDQAATWR